MKITVAVFATLRRYMPELRLGDAIEMDVEPGITMDQIRTRIGIPDGEVRVIMRNNLQAEAHDQVREGDRIAFFPPVAGG